MVECRAMVSLTQPLWLHDYHHHHYDYHHQHRRPNLCLLSLFSALSIYMFITFHLPSPSFIISLYIIVIIIIIIRYMGNLQNAILRAEATINATYGPQRIPLSQQSIYSNNNNPDSGLKGSDADNVRGGDADNDTPMSAHSYAMRRKDCETRALALYALSAGQGNSESHLRIGMPYGTHLISVVALL